MKKIALIGLAFALPLVTFAQGADIDNVQDAGRFFVDIINNIAIPLIFALAFLVFIWGIFKFFIAGGDDAKRKEGKSLMLYGLLGFFVMVSVWGLVNLLVNSVDLDNTNGPAQLPQTTRPGDVR